MACTVLLCWQLYLQLEVILSGLSSNRTFNYGSEYFLTSFLSKSINFTSSSFLLTNITFIENNNPSSFNASLLFDSYINITSPDIDGPTIFTNISNTFSDLSEIQRSYSTSLYVNRLEYIPTDPDFAQNIINSTLSYINITETDYIQLTADSTSSPRYDLHKHLASIIVGAVFVGLSTIVFIILNYFPENVIAKRIRRYQPLINQEPGIQLMAPPIPRGHHPNFTGSATAATRTITNGTNISEV